MESLAHFGALHDGRVAYHVYDYKLIKVQRDNCPFSLTAKKI